MKMKLILESWKNFCLLQEAMKMPQELPEDVFVTILNQEPDYYFYYSDRNGNKLQETKKIYGSVMISKVSADFDGNCYKGMTVVMTTNTKSGWGPLLYDLALEFASANSNGLMSDRSSVTDAAAAVWEKYLSNRPDVKAVQLDNMSNKLTIQPIDNCSQESSEEWAEKHGKKWFDSPLSKIYKKSNNNITQELQKLNKLISKE